MSSLTCDSSLVSAGEALAPGRVTFRRVRAARQLGYYAFEPTQVQPGRLVVSVHGISRNAREQARSLSNAANRAGARLLCPLFEEDLFGDYQRLGRVGLGERADLALDLMLEDYAEVLSARENPVRPTETFDLYGFSGGGQFAHRYAMANPARVRRLAISAPGWFTFPDPNRRFPYGAKSSRRLPGVSFDLAGFARIPTLVMVGRKDTRRDASLRRRGRVDREQGRNRLIRAKRWVRAVNRFARMKGIEQTTEMRLLAHSGHEFGDAVGLDAMDEVLFRFLYGDSDNDTTTMEKSDEQD